MADISSILGSGDKVDRPFTTLQYMKKAKRWLLWRSVPSGAPGVKPRKIPYYANGALREKTDTPEDIGHLCDYETALSKLNEYKGTGRAYTGLGFAMGSDGSAYWQFLDIDGRVEGATELPGYVEVSPSGNGLHSIGYGRAFAANMDLIAGTEYYSYGRYATFSGDQVSDGPLFDLFDMAGGRPPPEGEGDHLPYPVETLSAAQTADLKNALRHLSSDPYETWAKVALALHGVEGGEALFMEWSARSRKHKDGEALKKFKTVGQPYCYWKSVLAWAKEAGWNPKEVPGFDLLARAVTVNFKEAQPVEFVLDDFIATGTVVVAGAPGVGKSSVLMGMAMAVSHLAQLPGLQQPYLRRRVIFITEDPSQVQRIIRGTYLKGQLTCTAAEFNLWFKLIPSNRTAPEAWRKALAEAMVKDETETYHAPGLLYKPAPLIIFDTVPSNFALEDENSNAAASAAVAAIRAGAGKASVFVVMHTAKAQKFVEVEEMSARGAGAWGGDTQGEVFIAFEPRKDPDDPPSDKRLIQLGKRRFEARHALYEVDTEVSEEKVATPWGQEQTVLYRTVATFQPKTVEQRAEEVKERKNARKESDDQAQVMVCMGRFKKMLAGAEGSGLACSHAKGNQRDINPGWQKFIWEEVLKGIGSRGLLLAKLKEAVIESYKPIDDGTWYYFSKPTYGMGKKVEDHLQA